VWITHNSSRYSAAIYSQWRLALSSFSCRPIKAPSCSSSSSSSSSFCFLLLLLLLLPLLLFLLFFLFWEAFICTVPYRLFSCIVAHLFSFVHLLWISYLSSTFNGMALNSLHCAQVPFRNCSLTHSLSFFFYLLDRDIVVRDLKTWGEVRRCLELFLGIEFHTDDTDSVRVCCQGDTMADCGKWSTARRQNSSGVLRRAVSNNATYDQRRRQSQYRTVFNSKGTSLDTGLALYQKLGSSPSVHGFSL